MAHYDIEKLQEICRRYSMDTIYAFGSRGKELKIFAAGAGHIDLSKAADFDVALNITPQKSLRVRQKTLTDHRSRGVVSNHTARSYRHQRGGPVFSGKYNPGRKDFLP